MVDGGNESGPRIEDGGKRANRNFSGPFGYSRQPQPLMARSERSCSSRDSKLSSSDHAILGNSTIAHIRLPHRHSSCPHRPSLPNSCTSLYKPPSKVSLDGSAIQVGADKIARDSAYAPYSNFQYVCRPDDCPPSGLDNPRHLMSMSELT